MILALLPAMKARAQTTLASLHVEGDCPDEAAIHAALAGEDIEMGGAGPDAVVLRTDGALEVRVQLGEDRWSRVIDPSSISSGSDCEALADAVAAIVARGVQGVSWQSGVPTLPEPPPPPPEAAELDVPDVPPPVERAPIEPRAPPPRMRTVLRAHAGATIAHTLEPAVFTGGAHLQLSAQIDWLVIAVSGAVHALDPIAAAPGVVYLLSIPIGLDAGGAFELDDVRIAIALRGEVDLVDARSEGLTRNEHRLGWAVRIGGVAEAGLTTLAPFDIALRLGVLGLATGQRFEVDGDPVAQHAPVAVTGTLLVGASFDL